MKVRQVMPEDAQKIISYTKIIGSQTNHLLFGSEGIGLSLEEETAAIRKIRSSSNSEMLVAINDSHDIVGIANYSGSNREKIKHVARMAISVEKSYWGSDVSMSLMTELIKNARENGIEILTLEVFESNQRAINFYKKFGFEKIGYFKHFAKINGEYEDAMLMNLYL